MLWIRTARCYAFPPFALIAEALMETKVALTKV